MPGNSAEKHGPVVTHEVAKGNIDKETWNTFAGLCGMPAFALFERLSLLDILGRTRMRFFETTLDGAKIAQCAVGWERGSCVFMPGLQLAPGFDDRWTEILVSLMDILGACEVTYGGRLSLEPSREGELTTIPGVTIHTVRPIVVQAVDFSRWKSWDDYYSAISQNSKRNAAKAAKDGSLEFRVWGGFKALSQVMHLARLRQSTATRKNLGVGAFSAAWSAGVWILCCPKPSLLFLVRARGRALAAAYGWRIGDNFWYFQSGSADNNGGAAWWFTIETLKRCYDMLGPKGKFVMGYIDYSLHEDEKGGGLLRSRQSCRVTDFQTSLVTFNYRGPVAG